MPNPHWSQAMQAYSINYEGVRADAGWKFVSQFI